MKKTLVLLLVSLISLTTYAQEADDKDYYYYDGIENNKSMGITASQRKQIIEIKKGIGRRYAAIGRDRSLMGYEKGQKKRELSIQIRKEIYDVLNSDQRTNWDKNIKNSSESFTDFNKRYNKIERDIDAIEDHIDDLEDEYDRKIKAVERDGSLSKAERKYKKQSLKDQFKAEKRKLKGEKQNLKDSRVY